MENQLGDLQEQLNQESNEDFDSTDGTSETPEDTDSQNESSDAAKEDMIESTKRLLGKAEKKLQWFVVHTYSGHENKVKINLEKRIRFFNMDDLFEEIFIPTQDKIEVKDGKRKEVTERLFPGYILVKMVLTDETYSVVKDTPGVTAFVGTASEAIALEEAEVNAIRHYSEQDAAEYEAQFSVGEGVKIIDGPFTDFIGTVEEIDKERGKIKVLVSIFGRETPVELDFLQVSKL